MNASASEPPVQTLPAPPILPSDLKERASDPIDREAIDNDLVKSALQAMAQEQSNFLRDLRATLSQEGDRIESVAREVKAIGDLLSSRIDVLEKEVLSKVATLESEAKTMAHGIDEHTNQIKEVLRLAGDTLNMATTSARDIDRVRQHLGIPDELDAQQTPAHASAASGESHRS
jgi:soluble cytochrome b562